MPPVSISRSNISVQILALTPTANFIAVQNGQMQGGNTLSYLETIVFYFDVVRSIILEFFLTD